MSNNGNFSIEEIKKILNAHREWYVEQSCKYRLPCGICDKTGEFCSWEVSYADSSGDV